MRRRTRKHRGELSCSVVDLSKPSPLKPALPKKPIAYERKPDRFHLVLYARKYFAKPGRPKPVLI
jgi:hypothetical protein